MIRVLCITSGKHHPASRFRFTQWEAHARARGVQLVFAYARPHLYQSYRMIGWRLSDWLRRTKRRLDVLRTRVGHFDVVMIERQVQGDADARFEQLFRDVAPRLVLDIDDAVHETYPEKFRTTVPLMDQLVCGNEVLADAMTPFHPRQTVVIPTCIDTQRFVPSTTRQSGGVCKYGWIATSSNFPFLLELKAAFIEAAAQCQFELHVMTDPSPQWEELKNWPIKVECHAWSPAREIEFVQKCDIGLMPLPDTSWTRQKCGCKLLLSMACSRPVIASPVGTNRQIARDGIDGLWATSPDEWAAAIIRLASDPELRTTMGMAGRQRAVESYSLDAWADRWIEAVVGTSSPVGSKPASSENTPVSR